MPARRAALAQARRAAGHTQESLAAALDVDRATVYRWEAGDATTHVTIRGRLAEQLGISRARLDALLGDPTSVPPPPAAAAVDDELDALELTRRAAATDVGDTTLTQLEQAVDDLASSYATSRPAELLARTRAHLRYVAQLLDGRKTLREHRRLLVVAGWLSLLAATLHIDLRQAAPAIARMRTADSLAHEADHPEIRAWTRETDAWRLLISGDYTHAVELSRAAQDIAPAGTSALIQATAQEGRAHARLGDARATTELVARVNRLADPLTTPDRPEHHWHYDPAKAVSYTATTLAWVGDPAAIDYAREVITRLTATPGARPRRLAVARLDLALALLRAGDVDEAVASGIDAIASGNVVPSSWWRAREIVTGAEAARISTAPDIRDAYRELERGTTT